MQWLRDRAWHAGAAILVAASWLAGSWLFASNVLPTSPGVLSAVTALAIAAAYLAGRLRSRSDGVFLVSVLAAVAGVWMLSAPAGLAAAVVIVVVGMKANRPALAPGAAGVASFLIIAEVAALITITLLTLSLFAVAVPMVWVGATWLGFGLALIAAAALARTTGAEVLPRWPLVALAGVLFTGQVTVMAYGVLRTGPPGAPAWVQPVSELLALAAMVALAAVGLLAHAGFSKVGGLHPFEPRDG